MKQASRPAGQQCAQQFLGARGVEVAMVRPCAKQHTPAGVLSGLVVIAGSPDFLLLASAPGACSGLSEAGSRGTGVCAF